jgi:hypothetical protein
MLHPVSALLPSDLRFLPRHLPAPPSVSLTAALPRTRSDTGLPCSVGMTTKGLGSLCPPTAFAAHAKGAESPWTRRSAVWLQPASSLGWSMVTTFSESSPGLTLPSSLAPLRLLLADPPSPHGSDVSPTAVGSLSEGSRRRVTLSPFFVGYCRWDGRSGQRSSCRTIIPTTSRRNSAPIIDDAAAGRTYSPIAEVVPPVCHRLQAPAPTGGDRQ